MWPCTPLRRRHCTLPAPSYAHQVTTESVKENSLWGPGWAQVKAQWDLDPSVAFLNHGSFAACPRPILDRQAGLRREMERQPVEFLWRRLKTLTNEARREAAALLQADPDGLAF